MKRIVVVGASLAGVNAVETLRDAGFRGSLTLISDELDTPYDRPPLIRTATLRGQAPVALRPRTWYADKDVTLLRGEAAVGLEVATREVVLSGGGRVPYDGLVVATGSRANTTISGAEHVLPVRRLGEATRLARRLRGSKSVAVIGAGFLGLELGAALRTQGWAVQVVEVAPAPLARVLGDEVGAWFLELHERHGVHVRCEALATAVEAAGQGYRLHLHEGTELEADLVIGAMGATPEVEWLAGSGVPTADGVLCDERLQTGVPGIVAAGDIARWYNPLFDQVMRVEQWTNAVEQGRHAALSLLGSTVPYSAVPYLWSDQFGARMKFVGVASAAAEVRIEHRSSQTLSAQYLRDGVQVGGLCVNATGQLARHRARIAQRTPRAMA